MDAHRFDSLSKTLAGRLSRRTAFQRGGMGIAATALAATGLHAATAQQATPNASPAASPAALGENGAFLFVQTFGAGTWAPKAGEEGVYTLTLTHGTDQTVYFSDRPERIVGTVPMQQFLDGLGFTPANPPNAALVAQTSIGKDVLVIELQNPQYDATTLTYDARVLESYADEGLAFLARQQQDKEMEATFTDASLFIDDCPDITTCIIPGGGGACGCTPVGSVPGGPYGQCWNWSKVSCLPCRDYGDLDALCNKTFSQCNGKCEAA